MGGGWLDPSTLVAAWSAVAATIASAIAWRVYRNQSEAEAPLVSCVVRPDAKISEIICVSLEIRNYSDAAWRIVELRIPWPRGVRAIHQRDARSRHPISPEDIRLESLSAATSTVDMGHDLRPVGDTGIRGRRNDIRHVDVYLARSSIRSKKVSMRLILASNDAVQRRKVIAIKRTLPPPITAAAV